MKARVLTLSVVLLAVAALAIGGAKAQQANDAGNAGKMGGAMMQNGAPMMGGAMMRKMGRGDDAATVCGRIASHLEGRLAFLKAELKITPEQEALWKDYADAVRANATSIGDRCTSMMEDVKDKSPSIPERLRANEQFIEARLDALRAIGAALQPLYAALNDTQKAVADQMIKSSTGTL